VAVWTRSTPDQISHVSQIFLNPFHSVTHAACRMPGLVHTYRDVRSLNYIVTRNTNNYWRHVLLQWSSRHVGLGYIIRMFLLISTLQTFNLVNSDWLFVLRTSNYIILSYSWVKTDRQFETIPCIFFKRCSRQARQKKRRLRARRRTRRRKRHPPPMKLQHLQPQPKKKRKRKRRKNLNGHKGQLQTFSLCSTNHRFKNSKR